MGSTPRLDMTVAQFADWWAKHNAGEEPEQLLYLKDWHFAAAFPDYTAYTTPEYFQDDWLNAYFDMRQKRQQSQGSADAQLQRDTQPDSMSQTQSQTDSDLANDSAGGVAAECSPPSTERADTQSHSSRLPTHACTDRADNQEQEQTFGSLADRMSSHCQLAHSEQCSEANAQKLDSRLEAGGSEACDVECSDYRFVYLGCKVGGEIVFHRLITITVKMRASQG